MKRVPILVSGRLAVDRGIVESPDASVDRGDWAQLVVVDVDGDDASVAGQYWASGVRNYLAAGVPAHLDAFDGETVGGLPLLTDPRLVEDFDAEFGHVDFHEYYER